MYVAIVVKDQKSSPFRVHSGEGEKYQRRCSTKNVKYNLNLDRGYIFISSYTALGGIGTEDRWHLSIDTVRLMGWIFLKLG